MSFITKINSTDYTDREIVAGSSKVVVTNGDGVSGNPTIDIDTSAIDIDNLSGVVSLSRLPTTGAAPNTALIRDYNSNLRWGYPSIGEWTGVDDAGSGSLYSSTGTIVNFQVGFHRLQSVGHTGFGTQFLQYSIEINDNGSGSGTLYVADFTGNDTPRAVLYTGFDVTTGVAIYAYHAAGSTSNYMPVYASGNLYPGVTGSKIFLNGVYQYI